MTSIRKLLSRYNIQPRKRLGQSFLEDMNVTRRIVALAEPAKDDTIVEIGAGFGAMTEELASKTGRVIALEIDPRLAAILQQRFSGYDQVEVLQTDVLKYDFSSACSGSLIKVVGNIPYHISSPILFRLLEFRRSISSMILMFQKELANRITARPGTKDYGIPSILVSRYSRATCELIVPATCFYPVPDVVSSVLRISIRRDPQLLDEAVFAKIVRAAFARRRKTLWNNLRKIGLPEETVGRIFNESGMDGNRRAETLSVEEFSLMAAAWIRCGADKFLDKRGGI
jgi:16S rRNA (adenine1518-N6/adenine1519-N6)-dimethyltransferase